MSLSFTLPGHTTTITLNDHADLMAAFSETTRLPAPLLVEGDGGLKVTSAVPGFNVPSYDYVLVTYYGATNNVNTVVYKIGGAGGTTVATLTIAYQGGGIVDDDQLVSVTKS